MKFRKFIQLTVVLLLSSHLYGQNLIVNPGAESDPLASGWTIVSKGTDCFTGSNWRIQGNQNDYPAAQEGNYIFFSGCDNVAGEIYQDIDISSFATNIDSYNQYFVFSGYTRSLKQNPPDGAQITVEFRDNASNVLSSYSTGLTSNVHGWKNYNSNNLAPAGTRIIRVRLLSYPTNGSSVDGYFDNLSLIATTLPVELTSFNTVVSHEGVKATWKTASEHNNNYFTLLRSRDGQQWEEVIKVDGAGTTSIPQTYQTLDRYPYKGESLYRLEQTDMDGRKSYSKINKVNVSNTDARLKSYPNPAANTIFVEGAPSNMDKIFLFDANGREVTGKVHITPINSSKARIDISSLASGMYLIRSEKSSQPFYKQ